MINCYKRSIVQPKSETIVIPGNGLGLASNIYQAEIASLCGKDYLLEVRQKSAEARKKSKIGFCFSTNSYRLSRRGIKKIYHAIIQEHPGGLSSIYYVNQTIRLALSDIIKDGYSSVSICSFESGETNIGKHSVAISLLSAAKVYSKQLQINFCDQDEEFLAIIKALSNAKCSK